MTLQEFKKHCIDALSDEITYADTTEPVQYARLRGFIDGLDYAAKCFLPMLNNDEWESVGQELRGMLRKDRREAYAMIGMDEKPQTA